MNDLKFLLVDDATFYRRILRELVEGHHGWQVVAEAADGRSAVTLTRRLQPAVVLMDINMPGMNGIEATRELKLHQPRTRVVLFSGYRYRSLSRASTEAGADAFVYKEDLDGYVLEAFVERWFPSEEERL